MTTEEKEMINDLQRQNIIEKINHIQCNLNAPKDAFNSFAKYHYRSAESIFQAVKPLLKNTGLTLTVSDSIEMIGERIYVKATATVTDGKDSVSTTAYAREPESKKGADDSQITGAASSYARKYALCGLFAIDDNKDADATNDHKEQPKGVNVPDIIKRLKQAGSLDDLQAVFGWAWHSATEEQRKEIKPIYDSRKADFVAQSQE